MSVLVMLHRKLDQSLLHEQVLIQQLLQRELLKKGPLESVT
jgi:hypothetical protein